MSRQKSVEKELQDHGALPAQVVDVSRDGEPRVLRYLDLRSKSPGWRTPFVVEADGRACVHVFDGRDGVEAHELGQWCWRIALRGDGAWVGILEPGRLRVFRADISKSGDVKAVEVSSSKPGEYALARFMTDVTAGRDDLARRKYLTSLLHHSAHEATRRGLSQVDALSLVGRGLFWRFLIDRKLLAGLKPEQVCRTAKSWEQCLDTKARALKTFKWLDTTFNGGLLPFEDDERDFDAEVYSVVLGNIAHGATETGQLRLPTDWQEVNFSYVPVGLLSEVYEAFAYSIDQEDALRKSIHYTPSHLVDFVVEQAFEQLPTTTDIRVLDPAAGAGVFLVTAFRKLVERNWRETGLRPSRRRIREILHTQLVGFDLDTRALRLAELALYLTALELDPKPRPLRDLKFQNLRGTGLFDLSQKSDGSLEAVDASFAGRFDLVIGNPPWTATAKGGAAKKRWVANTRELVRARLGEDRAQAFDLPDTNMDLPFIWRAMEWAKPAGRIALVTHARWLFGISERACDARRNLLQALRVTGILNGTALRLTKVWPAVDAPWCVVFATNELPTPFSRAAFQFVSPALDADTDANQARIRIDWTDAQTVRAAEVIQYPWALKARFRGNALARRALDALRRRGTTLGEYLERLGTGFRNGYQVGGAAGTQIDATHMVGMPDTKGVTELGIVVEANDLQTFSRQRLLFPRDPAIYKPPLLLLRRAIPADPTEPHVHRTDDEVAFDATLSGITFHGIENARELRGYIQLLLLSAVYRFHELLVDPQYGMFVDAVYIESTLHLPIVPFDELTGEQRARARELSEAAAQEWTPAVLREVDEFVYEIFDLGNVEREAIADTLHTSAPSAAAKRKAVAAPTATERALFLRTLEASLSDVLTVAGCTTSVREVAITLGPWRVLEVCMGSKTGARKEQAPVRRFLEEANQKGASLVVVKASNSTWFIGLLERYAQWTPTRARLLASDLIANRTPQ